MKKYFVIMQILIFFIFAGVFPSVPHWRELQHRPELKLASCVLTEDRLLCIIDIYPQQLNDRINSVPNIWTSWTKCVQRFSRTVEHLSWSLSAFIAHKSHVYFYRPQSGVSLEETPKQRHIWLPLRVKQSHLVSQPLASSKEQYAARTKGPLYGAVILSFHVKLFRV